MLALSSRSVNSDFLLRHKIRQISDIFKCQHRAVLNSIRLVYLTIPDVIVFLTNTELGQANWISNDPAS